MNVKLAALGMPQWEEVEVSEDVKLLSQWLDDSWQSKFPLLQDLLAKLGNVSAIPGMPPSLSPDQLLQPVDDAWQKRVVAAAMPIPDSLGSFGPLAYSVEHAHSELPTMAGCELTWQQLRKRNDILAQSSGYSMFDAFHDGCGGSTAAILAGVFVQAGAELAPTEIDHFEQLIGRTSLGDVRSLLAERIPNVIIWFSCSNCQDYCPLGTKKGTAGSKGGDLFTQKILGAKAANAQAGSMSSLRTLMVLQRCMMVPPCAHSSRGQSSVATRASIPRGLCLQSTATLSTGPAEPYIDPQIRRR